MPEEDQPPQHIWLDQEALEDHFSKLKDKYTNGRGKEDYEVADMDQNELTKGLR